MSPLISRTGRSGIRRNYALAAAARVMPFLFDDQTIQHFPF